MACEEVIVVRYSGLFISFERVIVGHGFREVGSVIFAVGGANSISIAAIKDWDGFRIFPPRAVELLGRGGTGDAWWMDTATWGTGTWMVTGVL